jgi:hypothetical protein
LNPGGQLITHTLGFGAHTNRVSNLSLEELRVLTDRNYIIYIHRNYTLPEYPNYYPVVIERI